MKKTVEVSPQDARGKKRKKPALALAAGLVFLVLLGVGGWVYVDGLAYKTVRVEAGVTVTASDFLKRPDKDAVFAEGSQPFDIAVPGIYQVIVKSGLFAHKCTLVIEDTIAPKATAVTVQRKVGEACQAECFVKQVEDATSVTVTYGVEPDFEKEGSQQVQVILTDRGGNQATLEAELYLVRLEEDVTVEAGEGPPALDQFVKTAREASFLTRIKEIDYGKVGDYEILLDVNGEIYQTTLHVTDTVPPRIEVQDLEAFALSPRRAEEFVTESEDATGLVFSFGREPDLSCIGAQEVEIIATDQGGNETSRKALLTLKEDRKAPVIRGAVNLHYFTGEGISYRKHVLVEDNSGDQIPLEVDTSKVDLYTEGVYPVTYRARDLAGNETSATVKLTVGHRMYTQEELYDLADAVVEEILVPDMELEEKTRAIYDYVRSHVSFIGHSEKGDWIRAAYEGLTDGKGDCYVYACTMKVLLTRAGITNMDIAKIPTRTEHYWNLVDLGEGWFHVDATPRKDHVSIFLWTDKELMSYSTRNYNSHNYDHALYPEVN